MKKDENKLQNKNITRVAEDVISFHYISEAEAALLYEMLCDENRSSLSADTILTRWPRGSDVGDYSRPLRSLEEAELLKEGLTQHILLHDTCTI